MLNYSGFQLVQAILCHLLAFEQCLSNNILPFKKSFISRVNQKITYLGLFYHFKIKFLIPILKEFEGPLCGNGVIEADEECDCGFKSDCREACCYSASENDESKRCKLKPAAQCSPSQGVCCDEATCQFKSADSVCRLEDDCIEQVNCTGNSNSCPSELGNFYKVDLTVCNNGISVCNSGVSFRLNRRILFFHNL